jgi:hypothetical protein
MSKKKTLRSEELSAKKLYLGGSSGSEISAQLGISLKQVYDSLRRQEVPRRSSREQSRIRFEKKPPTFTIKEGLSRKERDLLISGLMLYYGEGAKTGSTVDFANSDPRLLGVFLRFLVTICGIDTKKLRFYLYCFSDQDSDALIRFWCSYLGVDRRQFTRPYVRSTLNKGKRTMENGVLHIRYSDKRLIERILSLGRELMSTL